MRLNHPKFISTLSALIISGLYIYNIISYTEKMDVSNQKTISKHAHVISDDIWRFDKSSAEKYLKLAIEANYYKNITVALPNDSKYVSIHTTPKESLEKALLRYNFIRTKEYNAEIITDNLKIGTLSAVVYIRNIYYYFNSFLVSMLFFLLVAFVTYLQFSKRLLNRAVLDRTVELKENQERLKSILQANPDPVVVYDTQGFPQFISPSFSKVFGWNLEEVRGRAIPFVPKEEKEISIAKIKEIYSTGKPLKFLTKRFTKSNTILDVNISAAIYKNAAGKTKGLVVNLADITEQIKIEGQLKQAQKMESIGTLAGGIAHDFNNILFPIVGHTEMLLEDISEDSPIRGNLNAIHTSSLRASELVKQILTFSRQESGELRLMKMQPVIKEVLKLVRSTIPTTIEIKQNIHADCGVIKADPTQMHQVIMNLAINAYHAMEKDGGEIKVSLQEIELKLHDTINLDVIPGVYVCLTITDTGIGMDKNLTDKIFDPFFTTKEKGKGTGMGLSVIHGIVKNMNGAVKVNSKPGKGTEFYVYLPVEKNFSEQQVTHSKIEMRMGTEQILLVDDEKAILTMEKQMLERLGYNVTSRTSSTDALEVFRDDPDKFDIVITDMAMPNMSGGKLSVELTKIRSDIPILICTGFSETMSEEKAASIGIKGFLLKPIVMRDLAQKIREVLDDD
jgi:PAS domain S-box-containing protein